MGEYVGGGEIRHGENRRLLFDGDVAEGDEIGEERFEGVAHEHVGHFHGRHGGDGGGRAEDRPDGQRC